MSRTPLFAAVKNALAVSFEDRGLVLPRSSALSRRRLLRLSAAAAGAAALSPVLDWSACAKDKTPPSIAIVGGGVAGLTAAYRLQAAGVRPVLFEASSRWGGRMLTVYDFYKGMFCELGGEFVDTNHEDLQKLGAELGVEMQKLATEGEGEDLYFYAAHSIRRRTWSILRRSRAPLRRLPSKSPPMPKNSPTRTRIGPSTRASSTG
jgi:monoamine oxidase